MNTQEILDEINKISPNDEAFKAIPSSMDNHEQTHFARQQFERGFAAALEVVKSKLNTA